MYGVQSLISKFEDNSPDQSTNQRPHGRVSIPKDIIFNPNANLARCIQKTELDKEPSLRFPGDFSKRTENDRSGTSAKSPDQKGPNYGILARIGSAYDGTTEAGCSAQGTGANSRYGKSQNALDHNSISAKIEGSSLKLQKAGACEKTEKEVGSTEQRSNTKEQVSTAQYGSSTAFVDRNTPRHEDESVEEKCNAHERVSGSAIEIPDAPTLRVESEPREDVGPEDANPKVQVFNLEDINGLTESELRAHGGSTNARVAELSADELSESISVLVPFASYNDSNGNGATEGVERNCSLPTKNAVSEEGSVHDSLRSPDPSKHTVAKSDDSDLPKELQKEKSEGPSPPDSPNANFLLSNVLEEYYCEEPDDKDASGVSGELSACSSTSNEELFEHDTFSVGTPNSPREDIVYTKSTGEVASRPSVIPEVDESPDQDRVPREAYIRDSHSPMPTNSGFTANENVSAFGCEDASNARRMGAKDSIYDRVHSKDQCQYIPNGGEFVISRVEDTLSATTTTSSENAAKRGFFKRIFTKSKRPTADNKLSFGTTTDHHLVTSTSLRLDKAYFPNTDTASSPLTSTHIKNMNRQRASSSRTIRMFGNHRRINKDMIGKPEPILKPTSKSFIPTRASPQPDKHALQDQDKSSGYTYSKRIVSLPIQMHVAPPSPALSEPDHSRSSNMATETYEPHPYRSIVGANGTSRRIVSDPVPQNRTGEFLQTRLSKNGSSKMGKQSPKLSDHIDETETGSRDSDNQGTTDKSSSLNRSNSLEQLSEFEIFIDYSFT